MPTLEQDITIVSGDDAELEFTVKDADGGEVDVSGYATTFTVIDMTTGTPAFSCSTGNGDVSCATGKAVVDIDPEDTASLSGYYTYDLQLIEPTGEGRTFTPVVAKLHIVSDATAS